MNKPLQKCSQTLSLVFYINSNKTENYICDEKLTSLRAFRWLKEGIFQYHRNKKTIIDGGLNTEDMDLENENFSDEDQCQYLYTWKFFAYIFFHITLVSILIFQKMTNRYDKTVSKKIYTLNSENVAQNFVWLPRHFHLSRNVHLAKP